MTHGSTYTPEGLTLYVSANLYEEVLAELDAQGVKHYPMHQFSQTAVAAAIVIVGFLQANGIGQIAQVIEAIAHRHDGKSIRVKMGDDEFEAAGDTHKRMIAQYETLKQENEVEQEVMRRNGIAPGDAAESGDGSPPDESSDQTS